MDELVGFLRDRNMEDNHGYAYAAQRFGGEALLDSQLAMLDLVDLLAREWQAMEPADERYVGLSYALRVMAQAYRGHPAYQQEWRA